MGGGFKKFRFPGALFFCDIENFFGKNFMRGYQKSYQKKFYDDSDFGRLEIKDFWSTIKIFVFIRSQFPHNILF